MQNCAGVVEQDGKLMIFLHRMQESFKNSQPTIAYCVLVIVDAMLDLLRFTVRVG